MAALGSQTIAASYEQLLHVDADGGGNSTTHVSVKDGDNGTTFGFTIASDALMMSSTNRLEFGDTGTYIHQSADGVLDLVSDTEIEINATTIDMNGAADLSGNLTVGGDIDLEGSIDVNGTSNLDAVDIDGAVQIDITVTVGVDDTGYDVKFFGATASSNLSWDNANDRLILNDSKLFINQDDNTDSLVIDTEATTGYAIHVDAPATSTGTVMRIQDCNSLTTGTILKVDSDSSHTGTRNLVNIVNDNISASGAIGLKVQQDAQNWAAKFENGNTTNSYGVIIQAGNDTADAAVQIVDKDSSTTLMIVDGSGAMRMAKNPAFLATQNGNQDNLSASTSYNVHFETEIFDQGGNFTVTTGDGTGSDGSNVASIFTAPVTGKYQLNFQIQLENMDTDATYYKLEIVSSNRDYSFYRSVSDTDVEHFTFSGAVLADMDTNDTVKLTFYQVGGAAQTDIKAGTWFSGHLAC